MDAIENALVNGIQKTIKRFNEHPYNYFTESDIHSSLINDISSSEKDLFIYKDPKSEIEISLIHNEYPTNFRYSKKELLSGYKNITNKSSEDRKNTLINSKKGDRGNFDLVILNREFVKNTFEKPIIIEKKTDKNPVTKLTESLKHVINKNIKYPIGRCQSIGENLKNGDYYAADLENNILYAIEVKLVTLFNARNGDMLYEVIKDNKKLQLANIHTNGFTKTINLTFCSSDEKERRDKKETIIYKIREYIDKGVILDYDNNEYNMPSGVINIFINSFISSDKIKVTKPIIRCSGNKNSELVKKLILKNIEF